VAIRRWVSFGEPGTMAESGWDHQPTVSAQRRLVDFGAADIHAAGAEDRQLLVIPTTFGHWCRLPETHPSPDPPRATSSHTQSTQPILRAIFPYPSALSPTIVSFLVCRFRPYPPPCRRTQRTHHNQRPGRTHHIGRTPPARFDYDHSDPFGELRAWPNRPAPSWSANSPILDRPVAGTYIGSGKVRAASPLRIPRRRTIIFDHGLSPQTNAKYRRATGSKVLDRSELILDIFASRAQSHEAKTPG